MSVYPFIQCWKLGKGEQQAAAFFSDGKSGVTAPIYGLSLLICALSCSFDLKLAASGVMIQYDSKSAPNTYIFYFILIRLSTPQLRV